MQKFINFIQQLLMINETVPNSIGLSQFKSRPVFPKPEKKTEKKKEIKLSDLMRRE